MPTLRFAALHGTLALTLSAALQGQEDRPTPEPSDPVVVSATRTSASVFELPYAVDFLEGERLADELQIRTLPESLRFTPAVSVQKTAHGQGSPKIRGQTGFRTLLLVDGIRINDSTWRPGNVEYWNQIDPFSIDRLEIVRGPGAVLWGSDAVSGLGQVFTKERTSFEPGLHSDSRLMFRYASAEDSFSYRAENQGNVDEFFGWHVGFSYRNYGDLRAGRELGVIDDTGYLARDGDAKLTFRPDERQVIRVGVQVDDLENVPRTHSTVRNPAWRGVTAGSDLRREHDHRRQLYFADWQIEGGSFFELAKFTASWKNRYEREDRVRSSGRQRLNVLEVKTLGLAAQAESIVGDGVLTFGGDWYHDFVDSSFREFETDGTLREQRSRGVVAGDADYDLLGLFASYEVPLGADFELNAGARWTFAAVDAKDVDVPGDAATVDSIDDRWNAVTGNVRLLHRSSESWRFFAGASQAFRAPNLSDLTRFDAARSGEVEVPTSGLDSEQYYNFEIGTRFENDDFTLAATGYYTLVRDQIGRFRTGEVIDGEAVVSQSNVGDGYYAGFEVEGSARLSAVIGENALGADWNDVSVYGFFDYVDGRIDQIDDSGREIADRPRALPPPSGLVAVRWESPTEERGLEAFVRMGYHLNPSSYSEADRRNTSRIPPDGLPGYAAVGLRGWLRFNDRWRASLAVENLGDVDYRIMDSGLNEPGINVVVTVETRF